MPGTTWKRGKKNQGPKARARRSGALARLEEQTKDFNPTIVKNYAGVEHSIPIYSENAKKRIKKEIEILKTRV